MIYPEPTPAELILMRKIKLFVKFDGYCINRKKINEISPLLLSWYPGLISTAKASYYTRKVLGTHKGTKPREKKKSRPLNMTK